VYLRKTKKTTYQKLLALAVNMIEMVSEIKQFPHDFR